MFTLQILYRGRAQGFSQSNVINDSQILMLCYSRKFYLYVCVLRSAGQRGRACDDAGLQHGESSLSEMAEEPNPAPAGGRAHRVVRVVQEFPQGQSPSDM